MSASAAVNFTKTDAGRNEIKTRAHKLRPGLRSLLLVIDGQRSATQLQQVMLGLRSPPDALVELATLGLIEQPGALVAQDAAPAPLSDTANRYGVLYALMSDAVAEHLGLRGYFMQLKIERCADVAELINLLPAMRASLAKARGEEFADDWAQRMQVLSTV
jgi:hypothetical protein